MSNICVKLTLQCPSIKSNFRDKLNDEPRRDQRSDRGRNQRGRGAKVNNANNKKGNLIQTVGFLSEGIAAAPITRRMGEGGSSREAAGGEPLQRPRIVKRDQKPDKADLDAEHKKMTELIGDDDELELEDDSKTSSSDDLLPIKIKDRKFFLDILIASMSTMKLLVASKRSLGTSIKKLSVDVKIKTEPVDEDVVMIGEMMKLVELVRTFSLTFFYFSNIRFTRQLNPQWFTTNQNRTRAGSENRVLQQNG